MKLTDLPTDCGLNARYADPDLVIVSPSSAFNSFFVGGGIRKGDRVLIAAAPRTFKTGMMVHLASWTTTPTTPIEGGGMITQVESINFVNGDTHPTWLIKLLRAVTHPNSTEVESPITEIYRHFIDRALVPYFVPLVDLHDAQHENHYHGLPSRLVLIDAQPPGRSANTDIADVLRRTTGSTHATVLFDTLVRTGTEKITARMYDQLTATDVYNKEAAEVADFVILMHHHVTADMKTLLRLRLVKKKCAGYLSGDDVLICDFRVGDGGVVTVV